MSDVAPSTLAGMGDLSPREQARAVRANELMERAWREKGVKVSSWLDFTGWLDYVDGHIGEPQLHERAKTEMGELSSSFGKYLVIKEEEPSSIRKDPIKRERARLANKIYKKICEDTGLSFCFFSDFDTWIDYVKGRIGESEFYERAKAQAEEMAAKAGAA